MRASFYRELLDNLYDGVYYVDVDGAITYWNKSAERISGYTNDEVVGSKCSDNLLRHIDAIGNEICAEGCPLRATMLDGEVREASVFLHHKEGHRVPVAVRAAPIRDKDRQIIGAVEIFSDVSRKAFDAGEVEELKKQAMYDELTGIGNRRFAEQTLRGRLQTLEHEEVPFGVLFIDIDRFKEVNDTHGHAAGDKVLKMVALNVQACIRNLDASFRWGGEELVVVVPNVEASALAMVGERIRMFTLRSWIDLGANKLMVTVSVGGTMARPGDDLDSLMERADAKMYECKRAGRNRVCVE